MTFEERYCWLVMVGSVPIGSMYGMFIIYVSTFG